MQPADPPTVVVWRYDGALLAVPLAAVEEIVSIDGQGRAVARGGALQIVAPPGLGMGAPTRRAVVVRPERASDADEVGEEERVALAAEEVEGVVEAPVRLDVGSEWLGGLDLGHLRGLLRLDAGRLAALLDVDSLFPGP